MWQLLESLENSGFATWLREAPTVLAYATVLAAHALGMAILVGLSSVIALRVLGFAPGLPLAPLERYFPLIWVGFWVNALSGLVLLSLTPVAFLTNPTFYIKMLGIAGAIVSVQLFRTSVFGHPASLDTKPVPMKGKILAGTMLTSWGVAIVAGRLTAYSFFTEWRTVLAVLSLTVVLTAGYKAARRLGLSIKSTRQGRATPSTGY